jgi:hypothetical protein
MVALPAPWLDGNHRYVSAAMALVHARLAAAAARLDEKPVDDTAIADAEAAMAEAAANLSPPPALERLRERLGLSRFQYEVLLLAAAVELSSTAGRTCAELHGDPRKTHATFGLALWILPGAHWTALGPGGALRRWRLVEVGDGSLTAAPIRIDERILHEIVGVAEIDERLRGVVRPAVASPGHHLAPSVEEVARCLGAPARPIVVLTRGNRAARLGVGCGALEAAGAVPLCVRAPDGPADRDLVITLVEREVRLRGAGVVVEHAAADPADRQAFVHELVERVGPAIIATDGAVGVRGTSVQVTLPAIDAAGCRALWEESLGAAVADVGPLLDELVSEFRPDPDEIVRLGQEWRVRVWAGESAPADGEHPIRARLRAENRAHFTGLAQVIIPAASPDDLVLPAPQAEVIQQIETHVRYRQTVLHEWGFARRDARGLGIAALFHGPSGTGKTLAAEVIARRLGFDLVRVDLSQVVSKYIGETEKNLARIFDAADRGACVLLFDEADALFGKRSEVRDSHDRYANIEVGYLLQRIEAFRGLAVLTTNLKQSLDNAFLRRLRFVVAFPFPDVAERRRIWDRALPADTPRCDLDLDRAARLQVTGGNIRNIALHAAFLAAAERSPVRMRHLLKASRDECVRIEKSVTTAEIGGWL